MEGFCYKKNAFVVKKLAITTSDYSDRLIFFISSDFQYITKAQTKSLQLVNKLFQQSPVPFFTLKEKKTELLAKYLDRKVENLVDLGCPRVEN